MFDTQCAQCGVAIRARDKHRNQKAYYCSRACRDAARRRGTTHACEVCGTSVFRKPSAVTPHVYCSVACMHAAVSDVLRTTAPRREQRANWKGGVTYRDGYRFLLLPDHPNANRHGYVAEHRKVLADKIGRPLRPNEIAHHIDGDKTNNDPNNLLLTRAVEHSRYHRLGKTGGKSGWAIHQCGCLECGTTSAPYMAKGLCTRCYSRLRARRLARH